MLKGWRGGRQVGRVILLKCQIYSEGKCIQGVVGTKRFWRAGENWSGKVLVETMPGLLEKVVKRRIRDSVPGRGNL